MPRRLRKIKGVKYACKYAVGQRAGSPVADHPNLYGAEHSARQHATERGKTFRIYQRCFPLMTHRRSDWHRMPQSHRLVAICKPGVKCKRVRKPLKVPTWRGAGFSRKRKR